MARLKRTTNDSRGGRRRISVRAVRREVVDVRKLGRAIVVRALAEAAAEAEAQKQAKVIGPGAAAETGPTGPVESTDD